MRPIPQTAKPVAEWRWPLSSRWAHWVLVESRLRGVAIAARLHREELGWTPCKARELLLHLDGEHLEISVKEYSPCPRICNAVCFDVSGGIRGIWFVADATERSAWQCILLEAFVLMRREANARLGVSHLMLAS